MHVDLSDLMGLASAVYVDEAAHPPGCSGSVELPELEVGPPGKDARLYIKDRAGRVILVAIPRDALAFQTGKTLERITHGHFRRALPPPGVTFPSMELLHDPPGNEDLRTTGDEEGLHHLDSTAATGQAMINCTGPGQALARAIIELERALTERRCFVTFRWTPAHEGVEGNEVC